ncbi:Uncharacterised protein [Mycobacteroides abscessus subsp. abscessus]|nr:Uncharacterised protein [Mycobacteroides abscessus subsp. abscessus]
MLGRTETHEMTVTESDPPRRTVVTAVTDATRPTRPVRRGSCGR